MKNLFVLTLLLCSFSAFAKNSLLNHPSPYLALHGNDPVDWVEWGDDALEKARKENKLLFISVGYFSCHWCHVMQRESFSDEAIAKKLNKDFISVKVDRELSPVLDKHLIEFVQVTNGSAGWPLNVFVTPQGYSLVGMTYQPQHNFSRILDQLNLKWGEDDTAISNQAKSMNASLSTMLNKQEIPVEGDIKALENNLIETAMEYAERRYNRLSRAHLR